MNTTFKTTTTLCAIAAALALSACDRREDQTAGERLDTTVASAERKSVEAKSDIQREAAEARSDAKSAIDKAGDKMQDAAITTKVNAELARDNDLSALKINVDTSAGHVVLRGTAPTDGARDRATSIAQRVDGVLSVDNQLTVANS